MECCWASLSLAKSSWGSSGLAESHWALLSLMECCWASLSLAKSSWPSLGLANASLASLSLALPLSSCISETNKIYLLFFYFIMKQVIVFWFFSSTEDWQWTAVAAGLLPNFILWLIIPPTLNLNSWCRMQQSGEREWPCCRALT